MTWPQALDRVPPSLRRPVLVGFALNVLAIIASVSPIAAVGWALVELAHGADGRALASVAAIAVALIVMVQFGLTIAGSRIGSKGCFAAIRRLRTDILLHAARIPIAALRRRGEGVLTRLVVEDARFTLEFLAYAYPQILGHLAAATLLLVALLALSPPAALAVVIGACGALVAARLFSGRMQILMRRRGAAFATSAEALLEHTQNLAVLRAFGRAGDSTTGGHRAIDTLDAAVRRDLALTVAAGRLGPLMLDTIAVPVFLLAAHVSGAPPISIMLGLLVLLELVRSLHLALDALPLAKLGKRADGALSDFLRDPAIEWPQAPRPFSAGAELRYQDVTFAYPGGNTALDAVSLTIPARGLTAITGPSGAGKSTLLALLLREADPAHGRILLGDTDIRDIDPRNLLANIAVVGQDIDLLADTLAANLRLAAPEASGEALQSAISQAGLEPLLERLPHGLSTVLGDNGATLSGGERQRLAIARAILKNAPILLFDEATSALDPDTEGAVISRLRLIAADRAVIVVTHRLDSITAADRIAVLESARLSEVGRHDELLAISATYRRLWAAHKRTKGWSLSRVEPRADQDAISTDGGRE